MMRYKSILEQEDYIMIDIKYGLPYLMSSSLPFLEKEQASWLKEKISPLLKKEMEDIYSKIFQYEKENNTAYITEIAISKTTILGRFLLENTDMTHIIDENQEVTYEKVVNAFNIAIFENNMVAEEILPLFQGQVNGTKEELTQIYSEEIVTYILENPSFELYLEKQNGIDARATYVVYENGEYKEKTLGLELKEEIKSADQHHFTKKSYEIH